jgi:hypothetical protein
MKGDSFQANKTIGTCIIMTTIYFNGFSFYSNPCEFIHKYEIIRFLNYVYIETLPLYNIGLENKVIIYISEDLQKCEEYSHFYKRND